ncbi:hypothetical protein LC087_13460 [Bacillus carboniphilus]|uniref:DUF262 domain-containing protein n=1 Tax=Bacillus carboniphilus TaxID=86663 RepID=A0ABY9JR11_9BACI|nr:hypothetical protein [Bacillus carboniphilus]WLR41842.1 hypothetical protein LC087_13460 [Bacillus carboniphilus]
MKEFINEELNYEPSNLASFDFKKLQGDKKFGSQGFWFYCDDTKLARAIYCVLWQEKLVVNCVSELIKDKTYRGDTLNSLNTLFGKYGAKVEKILTNIQDYSEKDRFKNKVKGFNKIYHTIGNFAILPNNEIEDIRITVREEGEYKEKLKPTTINRYRGNKSSKLHDYFDQFLIVLEKWYYYSDEISDDWKKLLDGNKELFPKNFDYFREILFLNSYFGAGGKNCRELTKGYPSALGPPTFEKAENYIREKTQIINQRAEIMIENIEKRLK